MMMFNILAGEEGCEAWPLASRGEYKLDVSENVFRLIFRNKKNRVDLQ
jgi:hypothetical protein